MPIESVMLPNLLILCHPFLLLPSIFPSIRVFSNESAVRIRWPKYWSFSFIVSPTDEYSGLISFRIGWLDLLAVQGILKSLLQPHSLKASILQHSAFFIVQLSHLYMTTGKTIALLIWIFVSEVMCLLFSMLSRFVIAFFPTRKRLLISWLQMLPKVFPGPQLPLDLYLEAALPRDGPRPSSTHQWGSPGPAPPGSLLSPLDQLHSPGGRPQTQENHSPNCLRTKAAHSRLDLALDRLGTGYAH